MRGSPEPLLSIPLSGYCSSSLPESDAGNRSAPIAVECPQGIRSVQNNQPTTVLVFIKASEHAPEAPNASATPLIFATFPEDRRFGPDIGIGSTEPVRQWLVRLLVRTARKSSKSICLNKFHVGPIRRLDEISTLDWKLMWHSAIWTFEAHTHSLNRLETSESGGNTSIDSAACLWTSKHETLHSTSNALRPDHRC